MTSKQDKPEVAKILEPFKLALAEHLSNPDVVLDEVLAWTGSQPFLTQKLCQVILDSKSPIPVGEEALKVEELVKTHFVENWETQEAAELLQDIRSFLLEEQFLRLYQKILQGVMMANDSWEQKVLLNSGVVINQGGNLKVSNRIYEVVFNHSWVAQELAQLTSTDYWLASELTTDATDQAIAIAFPNLPITPVTQDQDLTTDQPKHSELTTDEPKHPDLTTDEPNQSTVVPLEPDQATTLATSSASRIPSPISFWGGLIALFLVITFGVFQCTSARRADDQLKNLASEDICRRQFTTRKEQIEQLRKIKSQNSAFPKLCQSMLDQLQFSYAIEELASQGEFKQATINLCKVSERYYQFKQKSLPRFFRRWDRNNENYANWLRNYLIKLDCPAAKYLG
ncbi:MULTISPECIES: hypothetical protein [Moorena]|uniref:Uncharacterized protein n=1 Tax=Moorena producens 3L TaxID=489825 RepID=F4Y3C4_9CYAN|nr:MULTISPECIES: hypothetical protein [Moorena]EGJ28600.1 hypothetical protein LYNGBM3L_73080 [Moorena producens 3L]NEP67350.1 hypothetical protein [Moorena sp. SIO3A5]NER86463.1 hypothetical protein [Moorena sp. SIO3A2]NES41876.1 hypothetical protein [Moorena sp. SIO2C4]NET65632.1 hypothetical protein [Moorena sp. SIO1G6]